MFQPWARKLRKAGLLAADESGANARGSDGCQGSGGFPQAGHWPPGPPGTRNQVQGIRCNKPLQHVVSEVHVDGVARGRMGAGMKH